MKKALVIGAAGFVGTYLLRELKNRNFETFATKLNSEQFENEYGKVYNLNILDKEAIVSLLFELRPDYIFHLAAQSSVSVAWKNPGLTVDVNIKGSINLMDAARELFYKPRILLVGSGEEYGYIRPDENPVCEDNILRPGNIYAATKACQNMIGNIYAKAYDMEIISVRAFNHIGPGQAPMFVVSDFCKQVAEIEKGLIEPILKVGNLEVKRDFTDVRDVVNAYAELAEKGCPGETYNIGSGSTQTIQNILKIIISMSDMVIKVEVDDNKLRPVEVPVIQADIMKTQKAIGWYPKIPLSQTIRETLDYWRTHV